jgi:pimeloyl-ACP methyl ester carboxylesterase
MSIKSRSADSATGAQVQGSRPSVDLNYREAGSGRLIMFLHGWGMSLDCWDRQVTALGPDHRTITVDLRGHGESPKPIAGYDYEDHVADILALIKRLKATDIVIVGWSMGGGIAARVAARSNAVRKLVMVCAPARYERCEDFPLGRPAADCDAFAERLRSQREETMHEAVVNTFHEPPSPFIRDWLFQLSLRAPGWAVSQCFAGVRAADVRSDLETMGKPLLLLHGLHDAFVSIDIARWTAATIAGARLVEFERSGHAPFLEEVDRFNEELRAFVAA